MRIIKQHMLPRFVFATEGDDDDDNGRYGPDDVAVERQHSS